MKRTNRIYGTRTIEADGYKAEHFFGSHSEARSYRDRRNASNEQSKMFSEPLLEGYVGTDPAKWIIA